jgi:hypothetical protein
MNIVINAVAVLIAACMHVDTEYQKLSPQHEDLSTGIPSQCL